MKATRSGIVVGLALALLVPGSAIGQDAPEGVSVVTDPTGDLYGIYTEEPLDGPGYLDIEKLTVDVADGELQVTFDTAGNVPAELDFMERTAGYYLQVDTDGDGADDYWIDINSVGGWKTNVFDLSTAFNTEVGMPVLVEDLVIAMVSLSDLGDPQDIRFHGLVQSTHTPDPDDPLNSTDWEDRAPDDEDAWLALGDSGSAETTSESLGDEQSARAPLRNLTVLHKKKQTKGNYGQVRDEIVDYFASHPDMAAAVAEVAAETSIHPSLEAGLAACQKFKKKRNQSVRDCSNAFHFPLFAYAYTRDDVAWDLLRRYVGATMPRVSDKGMYQFGISVLVSEYPKRYPDLFSED